MRTKEERKGLRKQDAQHVSSPGEEAKGRAGACVRTRGERKVGLKNNSTHPPISALPARSPPHHTPPCALPPWPGVASRWAHLPGRPVRARSRGQRPTVGRCCLEGKRATKLSFGRVSHCTKHSLREGGWKRLSLRVWETPRRARCCPSHPSPPLLPQLHRKSRHAGPLPHQRRVAPGCWVDGVETRRASRHAAPARALSRGRGCCCQLWLVDWRVGPRAQGGWW